MREGRLIMIRSVGVGRVGQMWMYTYKLLETMFAPRQHSSTVCYDWP